ncbi:putative ankyrin repeat protein [Acanthamoeba polyphaga mimivirus]|uniref:Ankyrin repeat protein n=1 Tax=Acanthamoeba polyphaga mimivirus Kroon TaxID=3069720 RepID=A0A0G2Y2Q1_9VIRU|nr:putative ankyrin repeat protein [Acanthamoeba polyphaga mimivirus]AKI80018.1 putative ankyrin repeat protein [Acanthamoeba polyphaga mimivirus Kroon]
MELTEQLFMITGCPERHNDKPIGRGFNIISLKSFKKGKGFVLFEAKNIPKNYYGYYLRPVILPTNNREFAFQKSPWGYYTNMVSLDEIYELANPQTFYMLEKYGLDLGEISAEERARNYSKYYADDYVNSFAHKYFLSRKYMYEDGHCQDINYEPNKSEDTYCESSQSENSENVDYITDSNNINKLKNITHTQYLGMNLPDRLFIITVYRGVFGTKLISQGLNCISKQEFNRYKGFIVIDAKNIIKDCYGYFIHSVILPTSHPEFILENRDTYYYTNMVIIDKTYELSDPETFRILGKYGLDLTVYSAEIRAKNYETSKLVDALKSTSNHHMPPCNFSYICPSYDNSHGSTTSDWTSTTSRWTAKKAQETLDIKVNHIHQFIQNGDFESAQKLFGGNNVLQKVIDTAIKSNNQKTIKYLIDQHQFNIDEAIKLALEENKLDIFHMLRLFNFDKIRCLETASVLGHLEIVDKMLENDFEKINGDLVNIVLRNAAEGGKFDIVWYISEKFIDLVTKIDIEVAETIVKQRIQHICTFSDDNDIDISGEQDMLELFENMKMIVINSKF